MGRDQPYRAHVANVRSWTDTARPYTLEFALDARGSVSRLALRSSQHWN